MFTQEEIKADIEKGWQEFIARFPELNTPTVRETFGWAFCEGAKYGVRLMVKEA